jgi:hypothetical protein
MDETNTTQTAPDAGVDNATPPVVKKQRSPYQVFFWGGLVMAVMCFWLGTERLEIKRPARADAYFITGILGILSAAMAWSLGAAHERARRSQQSLQESLDNLQDSMQDMPRSLMEESVRVAAREAESRRADQERQARELRSALEQGITAGFAPMAPALAGRIEESLKGLSDSLRSDREERASSLKATAETVASLQAAQGEWSKASAALLEKLREQGTTLHNDLGARDNAARSAWEANTASARAAWEELAASARTSWDRAAESSTQGVQAALEGQMAKVNGLVEMLSARWDESLTAQRETFAGEWREVLGKSQVQLEQAATQARLQLEQSATVSRDQIDQVAHALREAITTASASVEAASAASAASIQAASAAATVAVKAATEDAAALVETVSSEADSKMGTTAAQAEEWLRNLSAAAGTIGEALEGMRRSSEDTAVQQAAGQAEWRATVEMFHQGMGGVLDRLQALGSYTQGQAALLERMEDVIRSFEERSAELIEDTALKAQESLLDALDQAGARDAAAAEKA